MIIQGSRYQDQPVVMENDASGTGRPSVFRLTPTESGLFYHYQVRQGDRFDLLAWQFYKRPDAWWVIADANPEIFYPSSLLAGSIIRIPVKI